MRMQAWGWYLAFVVAIGQYYFVSSVGSTPNADLYTLISVSGVVAVIVGIVLHRSSSRIGWALVAASIGLYVAGDAVLASLEEEYVLVPFPSNADWLYLGMYPVVIAGVILIRRSVAQRASLADFADAVIVGAVAFAAIGAIYMNDLLVEDAFGLQSQIVASAYPLLDIVLIVVTVWCALGVATARPEFAMLAGAAMLIAIGNAVFNVQNATFAFESGGVADLCWLGFVALLGAAALYPPRSLSAVAVAQRAASGRVWLSASALLAIPAAHLIWGSRDDLVETVAAGALAASLIAVRHFPRRTAAVESAPRTQMAMIEQPSSLTNAS